MPVSIINEFQNSMFRFSGHVRLLCNSHGFLTPSRTFLLPVLRNTTLNNSGIKIRFRRSIIIGYSTQGSLPEALIGSIWLKYLHNQGQSTKIFSLPITMKADPSWPHCMWCSPAWFIPFVTIDTVEYVTGIWNGHLIFRSRNLYYLWLISLMNTGLAARESWLATPDHMKLWEWSIVSCY